MNSHCCSKVGSHISRTIKSDCYHSDVHTYRKAIHLVLMLSTHFESPNSSDAQCSEETAAFRCSPLDALPAFVHGALGTQLLHLSIIDVTKSNLESLRSISSQMAAIMQTNEADARKGKTESQPIFIRVDDDAAHALQASSIHACDAIAERAQDLETSAKGRNENGITAAGISAWFFARGQLSGDGLPRIFVSTVS